MPDEIVHNLDPSGWSTRILIGTPTRGTVRIEWHSAVRSMLVPANWGEVSMTQAMSAYIPVRFQVADAQNLIVREVVQKGFEWLLLLEDDTIPPPDLKVKLNQYMHRREVPVVSGLYYLKSEPSEPLIYRGRGNGSFLDWTIGDRVWCDGVPTGCLLIHGDLLRAIWEESEEYEIGGQVTRRVFESGARAYVDPETGSVNTIACTSDLDWCTRVIDGDFFAKAGWSEFADREFPFLVDTSIQCIHIDPDGRTFPPMGFPRPREPQALGVKVAESSDVSERLAQ